MLGISTPSVLTGIFTPLTKGKSMKPISIMIIGAVLGGCAYGEYFQASEQQTQIMASVPTVLRYCESEGHLNHYQTGLIIDALADLESVAKYDRDVYAKAKRDISVTLASSGDTAKAGCDQALSDSYEYTKGMTQAYADVLERRQLASDRFLDTVAGGLAASPQPVYQTQLPAQTRGTQPAAGEAGVQPSSVIILTDDGVQQCVPTNSGVVYCP